MDCGGVVDDAHDRESFERARTDYLERRGCSVAELMKQGTVFSPARLGDILSIETTVDTGKSASLTFTHVVRGRTSGRVVVEGPAALVETDRKGTVMRLDPEIKKALQAPDGGAR